MYNDEFRAEFNSVSSSVSELGKQLGQYIHSHTHGGAEGGHVTHWSSYTSRPLCSGTTGVNFQLDLKSLAPCDCYILFTEKVYFE